MAKSFAVLGVLVIWGALGAALSAGKKPLVSDALKSVRVLAIPRSGRPVDRTVAEEIRRELAPQAEIEASGLGGDGGKGVLRISVADEKLAAGPSPDALGKAGGRDWMFLRLAEDGSGELTTSAPHLLYALYCLVKDDWLSLETAEFEKGKIVRPRFSRLEGGDNYLANPKRVAAGYDPEASVRGLARLGFSHVPVNALAKDMPAEQGPPGEIYYRFYYFSPDLDQFVETPLNAGAYSPEYLQANLALLKENARLAVKYGLTPGLNISSPRSVPESVLEKYPYLRGARVDHPFRSYRPRFTLTLSHPAVRWHYAELMRRLMREVPELGYIYLWTNDSGSGFEYTASLYAGRNGGAYLVREWKSHESIAKAAAENVLRYFRTLRDAATETRPDFRLLFNLFSFANEEPFILDGLTQGLDLWVAPKELDDSPRGRRLKALPRSGSEIFTTTRLQNNYLLGIPSPWLAAEEVRGLRAAGFDKAQVTVDPTPLAPYDVNRDILRALNFDADASVDSVITAAAARLVGQRDAPILIRAWRLSDEAVRGFPPIMLYGDNNWGFPWYRLLVRPFAPDIERIPEAERAYYEKFMTVTFNNPNLVDLGMDILWTLMTREQADAAVAQADAATWKPLDAAIGVLRDALVAAKAETRAVFIDQFDRLRALRCYFRTLRNTAAWVAGVHGYIEAKDGAEKEKRRAGVRAMVDDEIANARDLATLFGSSGTRFMPVDPSGETFNMYGRNLPELIGKKIALMEKHRDDEPRIDPDFMWRLPPDAGIDPKVYLRPAKPAFTVTLPAKSLPFPTPLPAGQREPGFVLRGTKGWAWTWEQYLAEIPTLARHKMNFLMSCYTSVFMDPEKFINRWWEPLPAATLAGIDRVARACRKADITYCFSFHPALFSDRPLRYDDDADFQAMWRNYASVQDLGVRWFSLSYDDIDTKGADIAALGTAHAGLANRLFRRLREKDPAAELIFCPVYYWGAADAGEAKLYTEALGRALDKDIFVFWTGDAVVTPRITRAAAESFRSAVRHRIVIWDNYPVNDRSGALHLGPVVGRDPDLDEVAYGYMSNPLSPQNEINRIPLLTCADYAYNPRAYDPARSIGQAIVHLADTPAQRAVLKDLVELYPGNLISGSSDTGFNCVLEKASELLKSPGGREDAEGFLSRVANVAARLDREFPGRYKETKRTIAGHIARIREMLSGRVP